MTMRKRTEEINVRVYPTEKMLLARKARKCGMNLSEYLRTVGKGATVHEAPKEELREIWQIVNMVRALFEGDPEMAPLYEDLCHAGDLLMTVYYGKEEDDGGNKDLGDPRQPEPGN
ncbi:MAG: hypothetical protein IJM83_03210 [Firmicutes bacterium]|nr:hypothetical protein [Lachnospiraceae bacterium]MBQ7058296.1 hypothetical protein [Bacillota bacterium]